MLFDNYGGRETARIFRNYFALTLFLEQLLLSFFTIPADQANALSSEKNCIPVSVFAEESPDDGLIRIREMALLLNLQR